MTEYFLHSSCASLHWKSYLWLATRRYRRASSSRAFSRLFDPFFFLDSVRLAFAMASLCIRKKVGTGMSFSCISATSIAPLKPKSKPMLLPILVSFLTSGVSQTRYTKKSPQASRLTVRSFTVPSISRLLKNLYFLPAILMTFPLMTELPTMSYESERYFHQLLNFGSVAFRLFFRFDQKSL